VDHRHLLPSEFDLLLDGDVGFGLTPVKAHIRQCEHCRAELEAQQQVVALLDDLPDLAPAPQFADRVMAQVHVFVPWHVTARDSLRQLVPRSQPARVFAGVGALLAAFVVSLGAMALLVRVDVVLFTLGLALERGQGAAVALVGDAVSSLFGEPALRALATGGPTRVLLASLVFLFSLGAAALLLRRLAVLSSRRQS